MKLIPLLIFFCIFLSNCFNNTNKSNVEVFKTDSLNIKIGNSQLEADSLDSVVDMKEFSIDSIWRIYNNKIPKSNYKEVFTGHYYKHYLGLFNNKPAELNLTLSQSGYDGDYAFAGVLILGKERRLIQLFGKQSFMKVDDSTRICIWTMNESDSIEYPIGMMKGHFSNNASSFKGVLVDEKKLKPYIFDFQESYTEGVVKLDLVKYGKTAKYKGVNTRYLLWRFKNIETDNSIFYLLPKTKETNIAKSIVNQFDSTCERFKKGFLKYRDENITAALEDRGNGHFETGIGQNYSTSVVSNNEKLLVIQYNNWGSDASSYGYFWTECEMYDLQKDIILKEKDILKPNYKKVLAESAKKHYPWIFEDDRDYVNRTLQFSAVTKEGILMLGKGNHGWMCTYFFFPISEVKQALKQDFVKEYLEN